MILGFWNCTLGAGSEVAKKRVFRDWCAMARPDLLFLEEGGVAGSGFFAPRDGDDEEEDDGDAALAAAGAEELSGMEVLIHGAQFTVTVDTATGAEMELEVPKAVVALQSRAAAAAQRFELPADALVRAWMGEGGRDQPRGVINVLWRNPANPLDRVMITGLHALSSASGGLDAVKKVQQSEPLHRWIVGGDFNYHLPRALGVPGPATFAPAWHAPHVNLAFTQWNRKGLRPLPSGPMHFANPTTFYTPGEGTLKTNDILDYVMYNLMTVTPLPIVPPNQCCPPWDGGQNAPKLHPPRLEALRTTPGERWWFALPPASKLWYRILLHFDHCPVLYDVQFPP